MTNTEVRPCERKDAENAEDEFSPDEPAMDLLVQITRLSGLTAGVETPRVDCWLFCSSAISVWAVD